MPLDWAHTRIVGYQGNQFPWHDEVVTASLGTPDATAPRPASGRPPGASVLLTGLVCRDDPARSAEKPGHGPSVSFQVPKGQSVAVYGRPGSLATDVLDVVAGLRRPSSGQASVDGLAVHRLRGLELDRYRRDRGLISMRFPLLPSLSVTDNLMAALQPRRADAEGRRRAASLLEFAGAAQAGPARARSLPAEQQWRIMIARALMPAPRLVLAEDPAPGLDPASATAILDLLQQAHVRSGFTLLLATGRATAASYCQRLIGLADGAVAEDELIPADDGWTIGRIHRIG
jgi:ABC-type lipoprotein export system ATPase subunit